MAVEIERKFLVKDDSWRAQVTRSENMLQGYLASTGHSSVRVRLEGDAARLNIKSAGLDIERLEFEYEIPAADAREIIDRLCEGRTVSKTRHFVELESHTFEIDEFRGENQGLVVAEVELGSRDEAFERPSWLGDEVSADPRYLNSNLATEPFTRWRR